MVVFNTRAGFLEVRISAIYSSHLEVTVRRFQILAIIILLLFLLLWLLFLNLSDNHFVIRRNWILRLLTTLLVSSLVTCRYLSVFFFRNWVIRLFFVALVKSLVGNIVVSRGVTHHAID